MSEEILYEVTEGVALVTLNTPAKRNALNPRMADALVEAFDRADADKSVGAMVIRGAGGSFCSGADLGHTARMFADPLDETVYDQTTAIYQAFVRVGSVQAPVIAAVRGAAVGAGMNLLLAADVRVVAQNARLISGFSKIGVHPGGGHLMLLADATSIEATCAMAIFGQEIDGVRAEQLGLAWRAVPDEEVEAHAIAMAKRAAADPELTRTITKTMRMTASAKSAAWPAALQAERASQLWSQRRVGLRNASK